MILNFIEKKNDVDVLVVSTQFFIKIYSLLETSGIYKKLPLTIII